MSKKPNDKSKANAKSNQTKKKTENDDEDFDIEDLGPHIFTTLAENVKKNILPKGKDEKARLLDYTVAIIHPNLITRSKQCRTLIDKITKNNFSIFNFVYKTLKPAEVGNLYYNHINKPYYPEILDFMTCGPVAIMILINTEEYYLDENGIKTKHKSPIERWKEMIGNKDPTVAKTEKGETLRGVYGTSLIKNGFWGSDSPSDAYRELSMLMLPLPSVPPKYDYNEKMINMKTILNFLIPEKPDHPNISGRLDLIGKYGPIVGYHILDNCFCKICKPKIREKLIKNEGKTMKIAKDKVITDCFIDKYKNEIFCNNCLHHIDRWSHLMGGLEGTHIMTNEEIDLTIYEMNKEDLYQIIYAEKGSSAKTILEKYDLKISPPEICYKKEHILALFKTLETDYYDRYNFNEMQNLINEDRRIRLNFWVSKMIDKPINQFLNPKLINFTGDEKEIIDMKNPKSKNFTLFRTKPIEVQNKDKSRLKAVVLQHPILLKEKLTNHEISLKNEKLLAKNISMINPSSLSNVNVVSNLLLLRNYELEAIKSKEAKDEIKKEKERISQLQYK